MKPTKNRLFCASSQRIKMLFPTQEKADNFIRFNADNIAEENEFTPVRSYYCPSCGGWHVTHHSNDRKYKHADNLQNKIFNLANFVNKLKKNFKKEDWTVWRPKIEEAFQMAADLDHLPQQRMFLTEVHRQLNHYSREIDTAEKNQQNKENARRNSLVAERNKMKNQIRQAVASLDIPGAKEAASRLVQILSMPELDIPDNRTRQELLLMTSCFMDDDTYQNLEQLAGHLSLLSENSSGMSAEHIRHHISSLYRHMHVIDCKPVHPCIVENLHAKMSRALRQLRTAGVDVSCCIPDDLADVTTVDKQYQVVRSALIAAVTALEKADNDTAVLWLGVAEDKLKAIPLSSQKVDILRLFVAVAEKTVLN